MTLPEFNLSPLPPRPDPVVEHLLAAGIYERGSADDRYRLSEAGLRWYLIWLPHVLRMLIARSKTPAMEKYVELEYENRRLREALAAAEATPDEEG